MYEERLRERERDLHRRELLVVGREMRVHLNNDVKPPPAKRKDKLKRNKVAKHGGISGPTGDWFSRMAC